ncbi:MAG: zinc ribbon domain-containing protein [Zetaproteobacteria bacterium CG_4_9_14_3_um_filter_49_83]|nr:MAG: hypothetical protein AUJ56_09250 [Zetaproteobacteria bacterium CG1_02_49_23]PIQ33330.1 MAG: zinc ribbon domain-containing protein [Zetaproteobacteria bacterium CG17_big_fil_post_rev_8_21_14_2_50_50_13]PIV31065.1 MAG: zinc ribbon domain-containing protein [Zetaproteobacteria bacterium CG02_land_8_20_14_3_00_50_9]PIY57066.1 MAG: zinc ribbon domain-containing protein [Zetaproteobacteria bacterium CG_4_10_14_0_8_um_filter_49_80]PJA34394.1 MAG: zinc ribbon domain-containing protein [Zetaprot
MNCPKCGHPQADGAVECQKCGIIFAKFERIQKIRAKSAEPDEGGLLWQMKDADNSAAKIGRGLLLLVLLWMSWGLVFSPIDYWLGNAASHSFLHIINLPFHEFGHIMFRAFGRLMASLGGSLGQLLMPLICMGVFLVQTKDAFAAAVALWWLGESFLDLVSYIHDANVLTMPLMGGNEGSSSPYGFHDWEFILSETGLIHQAASIAKTTHLLGSMLMVLALLWMLLLLLRKTK